MNIFFISFIFLHLKSIKNEYLVFPFEQVEYNNLTKPSEIISNFTSLEYYTTIKVAEPPQTIKAYIEFTRFHFYISNITSNREYIIENSKSFNSKYDHDFILYTYSFIDGKYANETLTVEKKYLEQKEEIINIYNFTFSMPSKISITNRKVFPSSIGLGFYAYNNNHVLNFLLQLKMKDIINETYFFIDFIDNLKGNLYIGALPHEIMPSKFKEENYNNIYKEGGGLVDDWIFRVDFIHNYHYNKDNLNDTDYIYKKSAKLVLDLNLNGMVIDFHYFEKFNKSFFSPYLANKICEMRRSEYTIYISCEKDKIDITKFKPIYFFQKNLNYTFNLDYNDLFIVKDNRIYFNILFDDNGSLFSQVIHIGKVFLKKYLLVFNYDQKLIGFYIQNMEENGLQIDDDKNFKTFNNKIIIIIVMSLLVISLFIILFFCMKKKPVRKSRKNEIEDNYDNYEYINNDNENENEK